MPFLDQGNPNCDGTPEFSEENGMLHARCPKCSSHYVTKKQ